MHLTEAEMDQLRHWFNELVAFMGVHGLKPIALLTGKALPGGAVEVGAIECRFYRVNDDTLRACGHHGVEGLIQARRAQEGRRRIVLPGEE